MSDSDGDFVESEDDRHRPSRPAGGGKEARKKKKAGKAAAWEVVKRSWETVEEGADGSLDVEGRAEAEKRRRLLRDTTPLQRGIIRHLVLVLDMSFAMAEKDLLPTRLRLTWRLAREFVKEYFEQNPISQMGIVGMRDGVAVRVSEMGGNPVEHVEAINKWAEIDPQGSPSLQNALEMCRGALFHAPSHGTREVLVVYGALLSSDPGDIHDTIANLLTDRIRVSIVGLAAQVAICEELCRKTNAGDATQYNIALDEMHYRELLLRTTTPPVTRTQAQSTASLLMMGFPSRTLAPADTTAYCACHNTPVREGYLCTRCGTRVCRLPAECPACGLTPHPLHPPRPLLPPPLSRCATGSRSPGPRAAASRACYSCLAPFPDPPAQRRGHRANGTDGRRRGDAGDEEPAPAPKQKGVSESSRYACQVCGNHFCIDCDVFAHEVIHNCPGCQSDARGAVTNGENGTNGAMEVDS
ncbi:suppressor of stem-loop protein [Verticillium alfalfae VaMs.102]|uniref:General transcription and DNA repair factor IIH n=1 Tax=Verticillium alfalfae (strain VaMs.102 / ATCC MYA-4576 / FGSC 10136) TaxID=526221 RepID=C9SCT7_VERA1|nr:suppressor of stem-loop protein [Verticillium alfalfae VaMs.102]EEY16902.1 suppressor of stem-loop protein [Verticillium alfalfae VaMs.102]